jgi:hypothetical protein
VRFAFTLALDIRDLRDHVTFRAWMQAVRQANARKGCSAP